MSALRKAIMTPRDEEEQQPESGAPRRSSRFDIVLVVVAVIAAAALRLDFMRAGHYVVDGDEGIVGLMAQHILEGRGIPTFYYGQHYMGSLEPLCAALLFSLFGSSAFTLQLTPLLFSLLLIPVMYLLGREVNGVVVGRVAAILTAVPPVALVVWSYKARGGFIELLVIGALATLYFVRWLKREPASLRYPFMVWLLLGVGWWVNNQIVYFTAPIAGIGAMALCGALLRRRLTPRQLLAVSGVCLLGFVVGSAPYWWYNFRHDFASLGMFGFAPASKVGEYFEGLWVTALPILLGAKEFWEADTSVDLATGLFYAVYFSVLATVLWSRRNSIGRLLRGDVDRECQVEIFFVVMVFACAVFSASTFGWLSQAPRYLLPLYIPLFIVCGVFIRLLTVVSRVLGISALIILVSLNLASCYWGGRALPGEPVVFSGDRVSRDHEELIRTLDDLGITKVRTNYWIGYKLAFETEERVTFLVLQEPRQVRMPEYQVLPAGVSQDLVPLVVVPSERPLFVGALTRLGYSFDERSVSGYNLIYNIQRPPMELRPISIGGADSVTASGTRDARSAVDQSLKTRWATGAPQRTGQAFEVDFAEPTRVTALRYQLGEWLQDYPRGLRITAEDSAGKREVLLSESDYVKLLAFFRGSDLEFWFAPRTISKLILEQTGNHPVLDWSIAEVGIYDGSVAISAANGGELR